MEYRLLGDLVGTVSRRYAYRPSERQIGARSFSSSASTRNGGASLNHVEAAPWRSRPRQAAIRSTRDCSTKVRLAHRRLRRPVYIVRSDFGWIGRCLYSEWIRIDFAKDATFTESMPATPFWDHPIENLEEALTIRKQIAALQKKLSNLFGSDDQGPATKRGGRKAGKRTMSTEARERIAAAQRARWAKLKGTSATASKSATKSASASKRRGITPEGRARLAAAMKARRKGGVAPNAPASTPSKRRGGKRKISLEARARMAAAARRRWAKVKGK